MTTANRLELMITSQFYENLDLSRKKLSAYPINELLSRMSKKQYRHFTRLNDRIVYQSIDKFSQAGYKMFTIKAQEMDNYLKCHSQSIMEGDIFTARIYKNSYRNVQQRKTNHAIQKLRQWIVQHNIPFESIAVSPEVGVFTIVFSSEDTYNLFLLTFEFENTEVVA